LQRLQALRREIGTAEGEVAARRAALEEAGTRARALKAQAAQLAQAAEAACRSLVQLRQQEQTLRGQLRGPAPGAGRSARAGRARARHPGCGGAESEPGAAGGGPRDQPGR
jgi:hypothetical protein